MTILHDSDEGRIIQLSLHCQTSYQITVEMTTATMFPQVVDLVRMTSTSEPEKFTLTAMEADAFVKSWTLYQAEYRAKAQAEEQRKQEVIQEAYALCEQCPKIHIQEKETYTEEGEKGKAWVVTVPDIGWSVGYYADWAYTADQLLKHVKEAKTAYERQRVDAQTDKEALF